MSYKDLVDYAEMLVNIVHKKYIDGNDLAYMPLLIGIGNYKVSITQNGIHNYQAVIDAIHNSYLRLGYKTIIDGFNKSLNKMVMTASNFDNIVLVLHYIEYELNKEDCILNQQIIASLIDNLIRNYNKYEQETHIFIEWLDRYEKFFQEKFKIKLL